MLAYKNLKRKWQYVMGRKTSKENYPTGYSLIFHTLWVIQKSLFRNSQKQNFSCWSSKLDCSRIVKNTSKIFQKNLPRIWKYCTNAVWWYLGTRPQILSIERNSLARMSHGWNFRVLIRIFRFFARQFWRIYKLEN